MIKFFFLSSCSLAAHSANAELDPIIAACTIFSLILHTFAHSNLMFIDHLYINSDGGQLVHSFPEFPLYCELWQKRDRKGETGMVVTHFHTFYLSSTI